MKVIFRKFRDTQDVIALFPEIPADTNPDNFLSYQHVGQHGACSMFINIITKPTTIEEATPLLNELKSLGYNDLQVGKKITRKDRDIRNANRQIW